MAFATRSVFRRGWAQFRRGAGLAANLPANFAGSAAAKTARRGLADLLFPPSCASCAAELEESTRANRGVQLCDTCFDELEIFSGPTCVQCGAPVAGFGQNQSAGEGRVQNGCYRCTGRKYWFDQTIALGGYDGTLRDLVLRMKRVEGDSLSL